MALELLILLSLWFIISINIINGCSPGIPMGLRIESFDPILSDEYKYIISIKNHTIKGSFDLGVRLWDFKLNTNLTFNYEPKSKYINNIDRYATFDDQSNIILNNFESDSNGFCIINITRLNDSIGIGLPYFCNYNEKVRFWSFNNQLLTFISFGSDNIFAIKWDNNGNNNYNIYTVFLNNTDIMWISNVPPFSIYETISNDVFVYEKFNAIEMSFDIPGSCEFYNKQMMIYDLIFKDNQYVLTFTIIDYISKLYQTNGRLYGIVRPLWNEGQNVVKIYDLCMRPVIGKEFYPDIITDITKVNIERNIGNTINSIDICPSRAPTNIPTNTPTNSPTNIPSINPTNNPSLPPTANPTNAPTILPSMFPTIYPTNFPTLTPTKTPTESPTLTPTMKPSNNPTETPTLRPTTPTNDPSFTPSITPSISPTKSPTDDDDDDFDDDDLFEDFTRNIETNKKLFTIVITCISIFCVISAIVVGYLWHSDQSSEDMTRNQIEFASSKRRIYQRTPINDFSRTDILSNNNNHQIIHSYPGFKIIRHNSTKNQINKHINNATVNIPKPKIANLVKNEGNFR